MKSIRSLTTMGILFATVLLAGCEIDLDACLTVDLNNNVITGLPVFDKCLVGSEF